MINKVLRGNNQKGVALILTLLILTILVVVGLEMNRSLRVEASLAGNFRDLTQAGYIAKSGVEAARALLQDDDQTYDALNERWAHFEMLSLFSSQLFAEGYFAGKINDEHAKFNPNFLVDAYGMVNLKKRNQLERLLVILGHDGKVIDAILDWLDPDDQRRPLGAERDYYEMEKKIKGPANGPLSNLQEMMLIKGMDQKIFYGSEDKEGLGKYLTLYSNGRININTAPLPVLMSLSPKIDQPLAQTLVAYRRQKPFKKLEDLRNVPGWDGIYAEISSEITVRSNFFSVSILSNFREAKSIIQAVLKREGKKTKIILWKEG
ncbi:MAG: type II secretion system minor pseudopilin GspK [Thermodesulfobacteriota bacterium]